MSKRSLLFDHTIFFVYKGCYASISLKVKDIKIMEPYVISSSNSEHKKDVI